jgi:hypothetical protein
MSNKPKVVPDSNSKTSIDISEQIARRAFELYELRGRGHGQDMEDWFSAEAEVIGRTAKSRTLKRIAS